MWRCGSLFEAELGAYLRGNVYHVVALVEEESLLVGQNEGETAFRAYRLHSVGELGLDRHCELFLEALNVLHGCVAELFYLGLALLYFVDAAFFYRVGSVGVVLYGLEVGEEFVDFFGELLVFVLVFLEVSSSSARMAALSGIAWNTDSMSTTPNFWAIPLRGRARATARRIFLNIFMVL